MNSRTINSHLLVVDVLLVTATQGETNAVLELFEKELNRRFERRFIEKSTYYDLGIVGDASVALVQSEMGSGGQSGSILTLQDSVKALNPMAIIMVGIAFGVDQTKQKIGDILVSKQLSLYELQRAGTDDESRLMFTLRGDRPQASPKLLSLLRSAGVDWHGAKIDFGLILSGEKLIDNQDFRDPLLTFEREAIGGEMEGAGLYAVAQRAKVDWILVKAICDWADGKKKRNKRKRQELAAHNAVGFVIHVLKTGGMAQTKNDVESEHKFTPNTESSEGKKEVGRIGVDKNVNLDWRGIVERVKLVGPEDPEGKFLVSRKNVIISDPNLLLAIFEARRSDFPLMMIGKWGTGKNIVLELINRGTPRNKDGFKDENLEGTESEIDQKFFGTQHQFGIIETNNGALIHFDLMENLLDKTLIADKLISLVEQGELRRQDRTITHVDVRVIGGATINLGSVLTTGTVRSTPRKSNNLLLYLYERLSSNLTIYTKQIAEMPDRVPILIAEQLASLYLNKMFAADELDHVSAMPANLLQAFQGYGWNNNFFEFFKVIRTAVREGTWVNVLKTLSYNQTPRVFISYGFEDETQVKKLYDSLKDIKFEVQKAKEGFPLPGQDWKDIILDAIRNSDFILICLSKTSVDKTGFFQREIREALEQRFEHPSGRVYIIPVLLDEIDFRKVPRELRSLHWAKMHEDWDKEFANIVQIIKQEYHLRSI